LQRRKGTQYFGEGGKEQKIIRKHSWLTSPAGTLNKKGKRGGRPVTGHDEK